MAIVVTNKPKPMPLPIKADQHVPAKAVQLIAKPPAKEPKEYGADGKIIAPPAKKLMSKQPVGVETKTYKDGTVDEQQTPVGLPVLLPEPHAIVGLEMSVTRNLGNYESVKMAVSLHLPCANNEDAISEAYLEAKGWVDMRVEQLNQEVTEQLG